MNERHDFGVWLAKGVERDRLRERERQARAQMSSQVAEQENPGPSGNFLFREPLRVSPSSADPVTQQIQSKLGDFERVRHFLDQKDSGLIGVDGVPPSPGGPPPTRHHMPLPPGQVAGAPSRLQPSPESRSEFKKPHHHPHHPHQRGGYVKPAEGKPPYGGRGGYPGQPVKHGSGTTSHRSNGILPAKGPPLSSPTSLPTSSSSSRLHGGDRNPRNPYEQNQGPTAGPRETLPSATPIADVDNIFKGLLKREQEASSDTSPASTENPLDNIYGLDAPSTSYTVTRKTRPVKRPKLNSDNKVGKISRISTEKLLSGEKHHDEFDLVGNNIASKLRRLPKGTRVITVKLLNDILSLAELGEINENSTVVTDNNLNISLSSFDSPAN